MRKGAAGGDMPLDADHVIDRRRLKRRLAFWRVLGVVAVVAAVVAAGVPSVT